MMWARMPALELDGSRDPAQIPPSPANLRVLVAAEGSGGHLIPALEVASALSGSGATVSLLYAQRPQTEALFQALLRRVDAPLEGSPVPMTSAEDWLGRLGPIGRQGAWWGRRLRQAVDTWDAAQRLLREFAPSVVAGFGGAFCIPVMMAARRAGIPVLVHEQNVDLGRANGLMRRWVDAFAVSFAPTREALGDTARCVVTGLPVRGAIGRASRESAARALGLDPDAPTVLVLGGSQGSRVLNETVAAALRRLTPTERARWQFLHLSGAGGDVAESYRRAGVRHWIGAHLADMATAYAVADVAVCRSGASTVAELAQAGVPAVLVPYPYARAHQSANARLAADAGAARVIDESVLTPERLHESLRDLLCDEERRAAMGQAFRSLARPDATQRLVELIQRLGRGRADHVPNPGGA